MPLFADQGTLMTSNPYSPPQSELKDLPRAPGSPSKAVLLGLAVDIGGSLGVGMVLGIVYAVVLAGQGVDPAGLEKAMNHIAADSWVSIVATVAGGMFSMLGGYVCARIAGRSDFKLAYIMGAISVAVGALMSYQTHTVLHSLMLALLGFGAILLGTKLGMTKKIAVQ